MGSDILDTINPAASLIAEREPLIAKPDPLIVERARRLKREAIERRAELLSCSPQVMAYIDMLESRIAKLERYSRRG
jgi:hypothetical protein